MDFSKCEIDYSKAYNGKNGAKMAVFIDGDVYMLKFPPIIWDVIFLSMSASLLRVRFLVHILGKMGMLRSW